MAHKESLLRKSRRWALFAALPLGPCLVCILFLAKIWQTIVSLGTVAFMLASFALGLVLVIGPLTMVICGLTALFLRVEASLATPSETLSLLDRLSVLAGILTSLVPAGIALLVAFNTWQSSRSGHHALLRETPWLGAAFILLLLAGLYWRKHFKRRKARLA